MFPTLAPSATLAPAVAAGLGWLAAAAVAGAIATVWLIARAGAPVARRGAAPAPLVRRLPVAA